MLKKTFFGLSKPSFYYEPLSKLESRRIEISNSKTATLHIKEAPTSIISDSNEGVKVGDSIKTGQKIYLSENSKVYAVSSVTGIVQSIVPITSVDGLSNTAISICVSTEDEKFDDSFNKACCGNHDLLEIIHTFLGTSPGEPHVWHLMNKLKPVKTVIIYGGNSDLLVHNDLKIINDEFEMVNKGLKILKRATGIEDITLVVPGETIQSYSDHFAVNVRSVSSQYPYAHPMMIAYSIDGKVPRYNKGLNSTGVCFLKAEAVATIGKAFESKTLPVMKNLTIVDKNGEKYLIKSRIGTPIKHIFEELSIDIEDEDKIIFGGHLTGSTVHTDNYPVLPNTDLIIIQSKNEISKYSEYPCINCGECIRVCPAKMPINLLVRFLEVGQYEEGADLYDLYSCIECGLCSYVCVSKIPIFQYIKLAKYELNRSGYAEDTNE